MNNIDAMQYTLDSLLTVKLPNANVQDEIATLQKRISEAKN